MNLLGFDFSVNKPALCIFNTNDKKYRFYTWPLNIDDKSLIKLKEADINVFPRYKDKVNKESSSLNMIDHIERSCELSNMIISAIAENINLKEATYISSEGFSFGSKGDAYLQLAGYKYILLAKIMEILSIKNFYTYSPISLKATAGCSKRGEYSKTYMIDAFKKEIIDHKFHDILVNHPEELIKKTNYIMTVDDLVDSYFCLKTMIEKENILL